MFFDLPLEKLQTYLPSQNEPLDFEAFWQRTLNEARRFPLNAQFEAIDTGLRLVETFDVTFIRIQRTGDQRLADFAAKSNRAVALHCRIHRLRRRPRFAD